VRTQNQGLEEVDPAAQQRMTNQQLLREKMLQNQKQEAMAQERHHLLMLQQQEREQLQLKQQQHQQAQQQQLEAQQQEHEADRGRQHQQQQKQQQLFLDEDAKKKSLAEVVREDELFISQQVRSQLQAEQQSSLENSGGGRTQTVHIEEIKLELARTRQALTEADKERDEVLQLLEEMAAAPMEMQSVVEEYLGRRSNSVQASQVRRREKAAPWHMGFPAYFYLLPISRELNY
jgi:hypothetical protein